jgi:hypothetical protein
LPLPDTKNPKVDGDEKASAGTPLALLPSRAPGGRTGVKWLSGVLGTFFAGATISSSNPSWVSGGTVFFAGVTAKGSSSRYTFGGGGAVAPLPLFFLAGELKAPACKDFPFPSRLRFDPGIGLGTN